FQLIQPIAVDYKAKEIILGGGISPNLYFFDFNGNLVDTTPIINRSFQEFMSLGKDLLVYSKDTPDDSDEVLPDQKFNLFFVKNNRSVAAKAIPYTSSSYIPARERYGAGYNFYRSGKEGAVFFKTFYDYRLYELSSSGLIHIYQLLFPYINSLPKNFRSKKYDEKRITFLKQNPSVIFALKVIFKTKNHLLFRTKML